MTAYRKPAPFRKPQSYRGEELAPGVGPPSVSALHGLPWRKPEAQSAVARPRWEDPQRHQVAARLPSDEMAAHEALTRMPLQALDPVAASTRLRWSWPSDPYRKAAPYRKARAYRGSGYRSPARGASTVAPWGTSAPHNLEAPLPWSETALRLNHISELPFGAPEAFNHARALRWDAISPRGQALTALLQSLAARGALIALPWGPIAKRQNTVTTPWPVEPNPGDPGSDPITVPIQPVYFMIPTLSAVRLPERTPVPLLSVTVATDAAAWGWTLSAQMPAAELPLVNPSTRESPVELEISINGYRWTFLVESFDDHRRFGQRTAAIRGRSRSAILATPYAPRRSRTQDADRFAAQLADEELVGTGWSMLWNAIDWLVPGGTYSYADLAPIDAIAALAASIGARVETDRELHELAAKPTYPISPWEWDAATPFAILPANIVTSSDGGWQGGTNANGVYVYSENAGFGALVKITGTGGETQLPMIVERLAVSADPARERGRHALASSSKIKNEQITIPLFSSPVEPGLIPVGALLVVNDGAATWRGQCMGVQVSAQRAGAALSVRQALQIERHFR